MGYSIGEKNRDFSKKSTCCCVGLEYRRKHNKDMYYEIPEELMKSNLNKVLIGSENEEFYV